jgi:hypothetical protein
MTLKNTARHEAITQGFIEAIDDFEKGAYSSRGLARRVEQMTTMEELNQLEDELLSHTFWVARHLLHQPACWAPSKAELLYLYRCLTGEEEFRQEIAGSFRQ